MSYLFGEFELDPETRQLRKAGQTVPVGPKAFDLLELLVRSRPKVVSRTRLRAVVWPEAHVGSTSIHVLVSQVRAALEDDASEPVWIRTVHRLGYAFCGDATGDESPAPASGPPSLTTHPRLVGDLGTFLLQEGASVLGREKGVAVVLDAPGVSRRHARIEVKEGRAVLEDLDSKNGTFVNGERLGTARVLEDGDVLRLGKRTEFLYDAGRDAETATEGE
jgi:DNA-binding winged helix-turn-helix (wHTH) protein